MKKIIVAFDGLKFSDSALQYAVHITKLNKAHLVGILLEDISYTGYRIYDLIKTEGVIDSQVKKLDEQDKKLRDRSVELFENACRIAGVNHTIHRDRKIALNELLHESIYADLLVIDRKETLTHYREKLPTRFIRDLLTDVQCPVLLVPPKFKPAQKLIILYDGEPSSVHAVKMISYLFTLPDYNTVEVLSVKDPEQTLHIPDSRLIKEFMKRHYPNARYHALKGMAKEEIIKYLKAEKERVLIALGAYRRGRISRWFRSSMADELMKELQLPLFIAHNK